MTIFNKLMSRQISSKIKNKILSPYSMQSYEIHAFVTLLYPNGVWIRDRISDIYRRSKTTKKVSQNGNLIYLATAYEYSGLYATVDVLQKDGDSWNIIEAFDIERPTQEQIHDMAFKKYVFELAGYKINKSIIWSVRDHFIHQDVNNTFMQFDVTLQVNKIYKLFIEEFHIPQDKQKPIYPQVTVSENAYIDYSTNDQFPLWKNDYNKLHQTEQNNCRIVTEKDFFVFKLRKFFPSYVSFFEEHIRFLLSTTYEKNKIFIHCADFEKAHHREMAKSFSKYEKDLFELNNKLCEWKDYVQIPMPTFPTKLK